MSTAALAAWGDDIRWCAWREEQRGARLAKIPYCAPRRGAKSDDPNTWLTRADAEHLAADIINSNDGQTGGVGFMLGEGFGGIDLDSCRNPDTGALEPWAEDVVRRCATYAEISPSGRGVKLFFRYDMSALPTLQDALGKDGEGKKKFGANWKHKGNGTQHPPGIELYFGRRYFTLTEQHLDWTPDNLCVVPTETLLWIIREAGPALAAVNNHSGDRARDRSRSATAFRLAAKLIADGATYEQMEAALLADPETAEWTETKGRANGARELHRIFEKAGKNRAARDDPTETGLASVFAEVHVGKLLYCRATNTWYEWIGSHWRADEIGNAFYLANQLVHATRMAMMESTKSLARASTVSGIERLARVYPTLRTASSEWNSNPFLIGAPGGTVDLRTGELRLARPEDRINRITSVTPSDQPDCPLWLEFLEQATGGDDSLIRFLRQIAGYCLTGDISEECLFFIYGPGGNGKGTLMRTLGAIMGDYAVAAPMETFTASHHDRHPTELARLFGARLVTASETEQGRRWAESRIKELTGNERPISARLMRQDFFEFWPTFKLWFIGNHRPNLINVDEAARRRFNLIPFLYVPAQPDKALKERLRAEHGGILRWAIEGCLDWQMHGLVRPKVVLEATSDYFGEQDLVRQWVDQACLVERGSAELSSDLFNSWAAWAKAAGELPRNKRWLANNLKRLNFQHLSKLRDGYPGFAGIRLKLGQGG